MRKKVVLCGAVSIAIIVRVTAMALVLFLLFSVASGSIAETVDEICMDTHGEIELSEDPDSNFYMLYYREHYYSSAKWFDADSHENDIEIGWSYNWPFENVYYYSDGTKNPLYIRHGEYKYASNVYIKKDYDWKNQTFIIDNTDVEIVFSDAFYRDECEVDTENDSVGKLVVLRLKEQQSLKICIRLVQTNGEWYFIKNGERWILTDEFVSVLKEKSVV